MVRTDPALPWDLASLRYLAVPATYRYIKRTEVDNEDPNVSNKSASVANEYDNEDAQNRKEVEIHESDSESSLF
jgi:hypothetical protein